MLKCRALQIWSFARQIGAFLPYHESSDCCSCGIHRPDDRQNVYRYLYSGIIVLARHCGGLFYSTRHAQHLPYGFVTVPTKRYRLGRAAVEVGRLAPPVFHSSSAQVLTKQTGSDTCSFRYVLETQQISWDRAPGLGQVSIS